MKIVIIGLGTIGQAILKSIDSASHTITVIDRHKEKIEGVIERYDVFGVVGNGACRDIQNEAEVGSADLVIVLTRSDELNILACLVAKNIGAKKHDSKSQKSRIPKSDNGYEGFLGNIYDSKSRNGYRKRNI